MGVALSPAYGGSSPKGGAFHTWFYVILLPHKALRLSLWESSAKR